MVVFTLIVSQKHDSNFPTAWMIFTHNCEDFANIYFPHLSSLRGGSKAWMNPIKLSNSHHARVNLVVQLQSEYGDQHDAYSGLNIEMRTY